jgi:hypothetical protein
MSLGAHFAAGLRVSAAILGTLPIALLASCCLARFLPTVEDARFAVGFASFIPVWVAAMCLGFVSRSAVKAWLACLAVGLGLFALAYGVPR